MTQVKIFWILLVIVLANACINGELKKLGQPNRCLESSCASGSHKDCMVQCDGVDLTHGLPRINPLVKVLKIRNSLMPTIRNYTYGTLRYLVKVHITASNVNAVDTDAFEKMPNIEVLHITGNNITTVLNAGFNLKHLSDLSLPDNNISEINFRLTKSDKSKLKIDLSYNPIASIPSGTFTGFKDLKNISLILRHMKINTLDSTTFSGINELNELDISENMLGKDGLKFIADSVEGKTLKKLTAVNCTMKALRSQMFQKLRHVTKLNLSSNLWETWPIYTLRYLKNLTTLTINNCPYFAFFKPSNEIKNVRYLSLHSNALLQTKTIATIFNVSKKLKYLDISHNHFQDRVGNISQLESLELFDMSENNHPLVTKRVDYYISMPNLRTFKMRNVNAQSEELKKKFDLGAVALTNMSYLRNLDLSHNWAVIREEHIRFSYRGLTALTMVDLSYNRLQDSYVALIKLFMLFKSVKILNLSGNSLSDMPYELFESMENVTELHLEDNRLTYFTEKYLRKNLKLRKLYLQSNSIRWIGGTAFMHLNHLEMLNITYNTFACDCDLRGFRDWMKRKKKLVYGRGQTCVRPTAMKTYTITDFEIPWVECDNMWIILLTIVIAICLTAGILLTYFRWDIKYWWILRRSRRRRDGYTELNGYTGAGYPFDGFVSYNSASQDWVVEHMLPNMEQSADDVNFRICFDGRDFIPGKYIAENIIDSIQQSRKLIFVITEKFLKSQWCGFELEMANLRQFDEKRNLVVLIFLEQIPKKKLPRKIRLLMKHMTYLEWNKDNERAQRLFWKKLKLCMLDEPGDLMYGQNP